MQNRNNSSFVISCFILLLILVGGCKRASPTEISAFSATPSQRPILEESITPHISQASPRPTSGANPFPTVPVLPSPTETEYPEPSRETGYTSPGFITSTPYPEPLVTETHAATQSLELTQTQAQKSNTPTLTKTATSPSPPLGAGTTETEAYPGPEFTITGPYPGPEFTVAGPYPGPEFTETTSPYIGLLTSTPGFSETPSRSSTPTAIPRVTIFPTTTVGVGTGTPEPGPIELPPRPPLSPPPAGSSVTIWHPWSSAETDMLKSIIEAFQRSYPDVTFRLRYVPLDELLDAYYKDAYLGQGPSLLFGPAEWGPMLFEAELITDLNPYVPFDYLSSINPVSLSSGQYHKSLISLPLSQQGMVMFRNTSLIPFAPHTFEELISASHEATHGGVVGSYLERGSFFSAANIIGLGGKLMDEDEFPIFDDPFGSAWFNLLNDYDKAGAVTFNTNLDLNMFKRKRVGIIIDGSWNISMLTQILGAENLAIDPWPTYGSGHMSGWVESESVFLNANIADNDRFAALSFIGFLLDPNVQVRLAEVGHIPSVVTAKPRDSLFQQAMVAFSLGVPYPVAVDESVLILYWKELDMAIQNVYSKGISPDEALKISSEDLTQSLNDAMNKP
jgi:ABC-type glycerol-3-phosphate transport system substrate-binding protein